jgi:hypothetical protein
MSWRTCPVCWDPIDPEDPVEENADGNPVHEWCVEDEED